MKISSRFTIALHILMCIDTFKSSNKVTSDFIANSVNVNSVIIRNIMIQLKKSGIISVQRGSGGAHINDSLESITLLDVFNSVESIDKNLFAFHENPNPDCPVGKNVHNVLDPYLSNIQSAMEAELFKTTLQDMFKKLALFNE